jgi:hypothetical protein
MSAIELQSKLPPVNVSIDGQPYDWEKDSFRMLMNENLGFGVQNDSKNIYIIFALRNRMWAELMQRSGVYIWVDSRGGYEKEFGLRYIGRLHVIEVEKGGSGKPAINDPEKKSDYYFEIEDILFVKGAGMDRLEKIMPDGSSGPSAGFNPPTINNPSYIYEFGIPIAGGTGKYKLDVKPGDTIGLGIEWGGMDEFTLDRMRQMLAAGVDPSFVPVPPSRMVWLKIKLVYEEEKK